VLFAEVDGIVLALNFSNSTTVDDRNGRSTHVAGIAAVVTNNARGIAEFGHNSVLMNGKVLGDTVAGRGHLSPMASTYEFADVRKSIRVKFPRKFIWAYKQRGERVEGRHD